MLLEAPGQVVTRDELRSKLWPHTTVDFDHGLNKAISLIREALGASPEHPRFVETVARRGYRFLADVAVIGDGRAKTVADDPAYEGSPAFSPALTTTHRKARPSSLARLLFGLALVAAFAISWVFYHEIYPSPAIRSLAVLPLENASGDGSQDYFADGMTDALITRLAQISTLRVISRTSVMTYKNVHRPLAEIARDLNVDAVVEGSVSRAGERIRVTAQLIDARNDKQLWGGSYDEDIRDTLVLQSRVTRAIAGQIRASLNPQEQLTLAKSRAVDPDAYEAYLKGRFFWNKRTGEGLRTAIDYFRRAITIDPSYAEAYAGLADFFAVAGDLNYCQLSHLNFFS